MSRLLDALRNLQQPAAASGDGQRKVTPRLAASIRRAVLGREAAVDAPILFQVPDAARREPPPAPPVVPPEPPRPTIATPDPIVLVDAIQASIKSVEEEAPAPAAIATKAAPAPAMVEAAARQRPQPTSGELELAALLADPTQATPYRDLLTAMRRDTAGKARPVVAIVGLTEQDATAQVSAALATLLAADKPVLLLEANASARGLANRYGLPHAIGLCESLGGRVDRQSAIVPTSSARIDLLPFGQATASQAQQLPQSLPAEVTQLRAQYDAIVIDAGPLSDAWAQAAARSADAVYLIVRLGDTSAEYAADCVNRFRAAGGKLTGCIAVGQVQSLANK